MVDKEKNPQVNTEGAEGSMNAKAAGETKTEEQNEAAEPAFALRGGGLVRIFARAGVSDVALAALQRHHGVEALVVDVCRVMQSLAGASREVKLQLAESNLWATLLTQAKLEAITAVAVLRTLAVVVTDDIDAKDVVGKSLGLFDVFERRLFEAGISQNANASAEPAEVFGVLCRLTARHVENKRRCLITELPRRAAECCTEPRMPDAARLAAGGFLVNLCGDMQARRELLSAGATRAAAVLQVESADLARCGKLLEANLQAPEAENAAAAAPLPGGSAFDGLFAVRRSRGKDSEPSSDKAVLALPEPSKPASNQRSAVLASNTNVEPQIRQSGYQRRAPKMSYAEADNADVDDGLSATTGGMGDWVSTRFDVPSISSSMSQTDDMDSKEDADEPADGSLETPYRQAAWETDDPGAAPPQPVLPRRLPSSGLKGNGGMKQKLASMREEAHVAPNREAWTKGQGLFSGLGQRGESSGAAAIKRSHDFAPVDREREAKVIQLAMAASAKSVSGAASSLKKINEENAAF